MRSKLRSANWRCACSARIEPCENNLTFYCRMVRLFDFYFGFTEPAERLGEVLEDRRARYRVDAFDLRGEGHVGALNIFVDLRF